MVAAAALMFALRTIVFTKGSSAGQKLAITFKGSALSNAVSLLATVALILVAVRIMHFIRARDMRRLASKWGLRYIGPTAPPQWWFNTSLPIIPLPLPGWISHLGVSQAWNIIEGENHGMSLFVFDGVLGDGWARSQPCTYIACQTEQSPFPITTSIEPVMQIHGWSVLHGVWFYWLSWFMGVRRLDRHLDYLLSE